MSRKGSARSGGSCCPDRFTVPKASVLFTRNGTPVYGLPERTMIKVRRHDFEAQKAEENVASMQQQQGKPSGPRHDAYYTYIENLKQKSDAVEKAKMKSLDKPQRKSLQTSTENPLVDLTGETQGRVTQKECRVLQTSRGNPLIDVTGEHSQQQVANKKTPSMLKTSEGNPLIDVKGEASKPRAGQMTPRVMRTSPGNPLVDPSAEWSPSPSPWCQSPTTSHRSGTPTRTALTHRSLTPVQRASTPNNVIPIPRSSSTPTPRRPLRKDAPDPEKTLDDSYRKAALDYRNKQKNIEQDALEKYPHGVPRHVQRRFEAQGLTLPPLGYGSNPAQSRGVIMRAPF